MFGINSIIMKSLFNYEFCQKITIRIKRLFWNFFYSHNFKKFGKGVTVCNPLKLHGLKYIELHDKVFIQDLGWLLALKNDDDNPILRIEEKTYIGHFVHIVAVKEVIIGENVLIADKVYIADNIHDYSNINIPIKDQKIKFKNKVFIGDNSWIGENVSIIGASIGKNCIIGANSVVTNNIPDYSIAVGSPAKIIKKYNFNTNKWVKS